MNSPLDYYRAMELNPELPASASAPALETPVTEAEAAEEVVAEVGECCLTKSEVASAVHVAVADAVQAAVSGVVQAAVAAAVKANVAVDPLEAENRFRQKYLGLGPVEGEPILLPSFALGQEMSPELVEALSLPVDDSPLVEVPRLFPAETMATESTSAESPTAEITPAEHEVEPVAQDESAAQHESVAQAELAAQYEPEAEAVPGLDLEAEVAAESCVETAPETEPAPEADVVEDVEAAMTQEVVAEASQEVEASPEVESAPELPVAAEEADLPAPAEIFEAPQVAAIAETVEAAETAEAPAPLAPVAEPLVEPVAKAPAAHATMPPGKEPEPSQERLLRDEKTIQFVGFLVGAQMYAVPSIMIREVIRRQPLSRLPVHTRFVPGVINLRGLVMPLVSLRELLQAGPPEDGQSSQFSIITGTEGLRLGLEVDRIRSMYVVKQEDIVWNVSSVLGLDDDTVIGLFELDEKLVPILSVERVANILLEEGLDLEGFAQ